MDGLTLRKAAEADSEFAYETRKAAFKEYAERASGWDEEEQRQLHNRRFGALDFRIISVSGEDVGVMALAVAADIMTLYQLFVLPQYQGRGIGRECMTLLFDEARHLDLPVRLAVLKVNPRAQAFYERLGFARTREDDTHIFMRRDVPPVN